MASVACCLAIALARLDRNATHLETKRLDGFGKKPLLHIVPAPIGPALQHQHRFGGSKSGGKTWVNSNQTKKGKAKLSVAQGRGRSGASSSLGQQIPRHGGTSRQDAVRICVFEDRCND
jgi:hypothetical protein